MDFIHSLKLLKHEAITVVSIVKHATPGPHRHVWLHFLNMQFNQVSLHCFHPWKRSKRAISVSTWHAIIMPLKNNCSSLIGHFGFVPCNTLPDKPYFSWFVVNIRHRVRRKTGYIYGQLHRESPDFKATTFCYSILLNYCHQRHCCHYDIVSEAGWCEILWF